MRFVFVMAAVLVAMPGWADEAPVAPATFAKTGAVGLGLGGGRFTNGLTGKYYLSDRFAAQALVGFGSGFGMSAGIDAVVEMPTLADDKAFSVNWHLAAGPSLGYYSVLGSLGSGMFTVSAAAGVGLRLKDYPLELTAELRPTMLFNTYVGGFYFGGGGAVRYYFP